MIFAIFLKPTPLFQPANLTNFCKSTPLFTYSRLLVYLGHQNILLLFRARACIEFAMPGAAGTT